MSADWWTWVKTQFLGSARSHELEETARLYARVKSTLGDSPFADEKRLERFLIDLIVEICERRGATTIRLRIVSRPQPRMRPASTASGIPMKTSGAASRNQPLRP